MLYRQLPKVKRFLAYLPEGPVIDWDADRPRGWLAPMAAHLAAAGRLRHPDGAAGGHPPLGRRRGEGRGRRRGGAPPRRRPARREREPRGARVVSQAARAGLAAAGGRGRLRRRSAAVQLPDPAARRRRRPAHRGRRPQGHEPAVAAQHQEGRQGGRRHRARPGRPARAASSSGSTTSTCTPRSATTSRRGRCPTSATMFRALLGARTPTGSRCSPPSTRATSSRRRSWSRSAATSGTPTAPPPPRSARCAAPTPCSGR